MNTITEAQIHGIQKRFWDYVPEHLEHMLSDDWFLNIARKCIIKELGKPSSSQSGFSSICIEAYEPFSFEFARRRGLKVTVTLGGGCSSVVHPLNYIDHQLVVAIVKFFRATSADTSGSNCHGGDFCPILGLCMT